MNVVKDIQNLIQLIHSRDEIIVFPIGAEGQQLLDFLRYTNFLNRVCCIAAPKVEGDNTEQRIVHEVPVIPFEHLVHFRETAIFVVAGPEKFYQNVSAELTRYGCKMFVFTSNELQAQIKDALQHMASTGQIMMWFMNHFEQKIFKLEHKIEEQNEISEFNTKAFAEYRNAFRDKEVVILGNGPTLNYYKLIPDAIHIGLNRAWKREDIPLDYLFTMDGFGNKNASLKVEQGFKRVRRKIFRGKYVDRSQTSSYNFSEDITFHSQNLVNFFVNDHEFDQIIHQNICHYPLPDFFSVVSVALHFAIFTYPEKIYLVGCDTSDTGHFYDKKDQKSDSTMNFPKVKVGYARMKMFARLYYPETEIISINPVGLRGLFKDVYTDEYLKALEEEKKSSEKLKEG